jgi:hypothetical protein
MFYIKQKLNYTICIAYFFVRYCVDHITQGCAMSGRLVDVRSPQSPAFKFRLAGMGFVVDGVAF